MRKTTGESAKLPYRRPLGQVATTDDLKPISVQLDLLCYVAQEVMLRDSSMVRIVDRWGGADYKSLSSNAQVDGSIISPVFRVKKEISV